MEGKVPIEGGHLHVRVDGPEHAPPVLLINSLGCTLDLWDAQVEAWAPDFRVIRYDTRGHGQSSVVPGEYTINDLGDDAVRVLDAAGVDRAHVCGISLGGLTAIWLGVHRPARVRGLILANTAARVGTPERWIERVEKVRREGMTAIADLAIANWFTPEFREREPAVVARFHRMVASCSPDGYIGCCAALRDADLRDSLPSIRARTLVIGADRDPSTPLKDAELIAERVPGATLLTFSAAHLTNVEQAASFSHHGATFFRLADAEPSRASGERARRRVLGDAHVDRALASATTFEAEFQDLITRYVWGEIWTRPGLDERTRRVLVIGTLIALARWEEFAMHVRAAIQHGGFTPDDVKEIILQQAAYCGVPAAHHALKVAREAIGA